MSYRYFEVGYKVVKLGKHTVSCAMGALGGLMQRPFLPGALKSSVAATVLVIGAATADLAVADTTLPDVVALSGNLSGNLNGHLAGGYLITDDVRFSGNAGIIIGTTSEQSLVHNFDTRGGAGSGGGAGLGGVFFVDSGATLTVINTDFKSNRVQGGQGGSDPALRFYDRTTNVVGQTVNLPSLTIIADIETLEFNTTTNAFEFDTVSVSSDVVGMLKSGSSVVFSDYAASGQIGSVTSSLVQFDDAVSIASQNVLSLTSSDLAVTDDEVEITYQITGVGDATSVTAPDGLDTISIGSKFVAGTSSVRVQKIATVTDLEYYTAEDDAAYNSGAGAGGQLQGKIKAVILDTDISNESSLTTFDFFAAPSFDAAQFNVSDGGTVNVTSSLGTFTEGMTVIYEENGVEKTAEITGVSTDGRSFTVDQTLPSDFSSFEAIENPIISDNVVRIADAASKFTLGQRVYVPGEDGIAFEGTVAAVSDDSLTVTPTSSGNLSDFYDASVGLALLSSSASVVNSGAAIEVQFDTSLQSGETTDQRDARILALLQGRLVDGASFAKETTITTVVVGDGVVTLGLSDSIGASDPVDYFKVYSPLSVGGSMNNITSPDEDAEVAESGVSANWLASFFNEGEGVDGTNGAPAPDADDGHGFNGGDGGNGSDGQPINVFLMYDLATAIAGTVTAGMDISLASAELAGALSPDPVVGLAVGVPDPVEIAAASLGMSKATIDLTVAIADLTLATVNVGYWASQLGQGLAGLGGAGGDGGEASGGADFFGGGTGGAGGDGGDGAISISDGGDGGTGGRGGDGGFGAGGGQGGAGGEAGENGYAAGGDPGDGGFAGFGAGEGANGNGMRGGGGSGLGGAIFVREGGSVVIQGNSLFELNYVAGGSTTSELGEAGMSAGSDLFMMKGANVRLEPGAGNEIRFEGDIADDSLATNDGFMNSAGDGADITIAGAGGLVVFNGENTYSGNTILEGASLTAEVGVGVNDSSLIRFNGAGVSTTVSDATGGLSLGTVGTFLLQDDYIRRAGLDPAETAWTGSGGFASGVAGETVVNLGQLDAETGDGQDLTWSEDGFFVMSSTTGAGMNGTLTFGSELAIGGIRFTNDVDLNGFDGSGAGTIGRVAVFNTGSVASSYATLSGDWTDGGLLVGDAASGSSYDGTLFMTGTNTLSELLLANGRLSTYSSEGEAGQLMATASNITVYADSNLDTFGTETLTSATVLDSGTWAAAGVTETTGSIVNGGTIYVLGANASAESFGGSSYDLETALTSTLGLTYLDDDFAEWNGVMTVGGNVTNTQTASFGQFGTMTVSGAVANAGSWIGMGTLSVTGDLSNSGLLMHDAQEAGKLAVDGDLGNTGTWTSFGILNVEGDLTNDGQLVLTGTGDVTGDLTNEDALTLDGTLTVGSDMSNTASAALMQSGDITVVGNVANAGTWNTQNDATITAATLSGDGDFLLASLAEQEVTTEGVTETTLVEGDATQLSLNLSDDSSFDGVFEGAGDLAKQGDGILALSQDQLFSGELHVEEGSVVANATMSDDLDIVVDQGAFYTANVADTVASVRNAGTFTLASNADFTTVQGFRNGSPNTLNMAADVTTQNGSFQNDGRTVVSGERTLTIGAADGVTTGLTGSADGDFEIAVGYGLTINQDGDTTYSGEISRLGDTSGYFAKAGDGVLTVSGLMSVLDIRIQEGSLALDGAYIVDENAGIAISEAAYLVLVSGDQSIDSLSGEGFVELGGNNLDIRKGGAFSGTINGKGIVQVQTGDFEIGGTLTSSSEESEFVVQAASTTRVGSSGTLDVEVLSVDGILELGGGDAKVVAESATVTGFLRGSGTIDARTTIAGGNLNPGSSPGMLSFAALTLGDGSTTTLDVDEAGSAAVAGDDYDRLNVEAGGTFVIDDGAALVLVENDASDLGETTQLLSFDELAVTGYFETASTNVITGGVMNLATGNLVGLGGRTLSQLEALSTTTNERAMYDGLLVNDAGGVAQFYGGRFVENLTAAWANDGDLDAVFERASPEVYAGLGASAQAAALNGGPKWIDGFVGERGTQGSFVDISNTSLAADDHSSTQMAFGVKSANATAGFNQTVGDDLAVMVSLGSASTDLNGDYMDGTGNGLTAGVALFGKVPNSSGLSWAVGLRHSALTLDGTRATNNGLVSFEDVDASATQVSIGLEYQGGSDQTDIGLRGSLTFGSSSSDGFSEMAGASNPLDAMAVSAVDDDYSQFDFGIRLGTQVSAMTGMFGEVDVSIPLGNSVNGIAASYDAGQGAFAVNSRGLDATSFAASVGIDQKISETGTLSVSLGATNSWTKEADFKASLSARFQF